MKDAVKHPVTVNAMHLLLAATALVAISVASLIFQVVTKESIDRVDHVTREIQTAVRPLCLTPGTLDACRKQVNEAPQPAVVRLCEIVTTKLTLDPHICRRPEFGGNADIGAAEAKQDRANGDPGAVSSDAASGADDTTPPSDDTTPPDTSTPPSDGGSDGGSSTGGGNGTTNPPDDGGSGGSGTGGGTTVPDPEPSNPDNGTCILGLACVNVNGPADDSLLPDNVDVPGIHGH